MDNTYDSISFKNPKYEDDIISVNFIPSKKYFLHKTRTAGKMYWWKFLGLIPIFPYTAKKNKYRSEFGVRSKDIDCVLFDLQEFTSKKYFKDASNESIFVKPYVETVFVNKANNVIYSRKKWFDENEKAKEYYDEMIKKIKNS